MMEGRDGPGTLVAALHHRPLLAKSAQQTPIGIEHTAKTLAVLAARDATGAPASMMLDSSLPS